MKVTCLASPHLMQKDKLELQKKSPIRSKVIQMGTETVRKTLEIDLLFMMKKKKKKDFDNARSYPGGLG